MRAPRKLIPSLHSARLKNEPDVQLFKWLAFLNRRKDKDVALDLQRAAQHSL